MQTIQTNDGIRITGRANKLAAQVMRDTKTIEGSVIALVSYDDYASFFERDSNETWAVRPGILNVGENLVMPSLCVPKGYLWYADALQVAKATELLEELSMKDDAEEYWFIRKALRVDGLINCSALSILKQVKIEHV